MPHKIKIKAKQVSAGDLDTGSVKAVIEEGVVEAIGADVSLPLKIGDRIRFKGWAVDIFTSEGQTIYFIDERTLGICEKI